MRYFFNYIFYKHFTLLLCLILWGGICYSQTPLPTPHPIELKLSAPPYFREGDRVHIKAILHNKDKREITGQVALQVIDDSSHESADGWFRNFFPNQFFTIPGDTINITDFYLEIPYEYGRLVQFKLFVAYEQSIDSTIFHIPVIHNRINISSKPIASSYIEVKEWLERKGEKKRLLEKNPVLKVGDKITKTIRLLNQAPFEKIIVEELLCSGTTLQTTSPTNLNTLQVLNRTLRKNKPLQIETIAQFEGSFIHNQTILKNIQGKILQTYGFGEVLHIEEN